MGINNNYKNVLDNPKFYLLTHS